MYKYATEERAFREGYYQCGDDVMNWLNSLDSSEMTVTDFRNALNHFVLTIRPDFTRYPYSDSRTNLNKEEDSVHA